MKHIYKIFMMLALVGAITSCQEENPTGGEGRVCLSVYVNDNIQQLSRSTETDSLAKNCTIYIYSQQGLIRKYHSIDEVPGEMWLTSGDYTVSAWAGDSVSASFDKRYYRGSSDFTVKRDATATAKVTCKIVNTVASVSFDSSVDEVLSDYHVTIGHSDGTLDFSRDNEDAKGYYMMPSGEKDLTWTLTGVTKTGQPYTQTGTIADAKSATEYTVKFSYKGGEAEFGGVMLNVVVDETCLTVEDNIELTAAPRITGSGFDITHPIYGEKGTFSQMTVYAMAVSNIESAVLTCTQFADMELGSSSVDLLSMDDEAAQKVAEMGITHSYTYNEGIDAGILKMTFETDFLNRLLDGTHEIEIKVRDTSGKSRIQTLTIEISDALVYTTDADAQKIYSTTATVNGEIANAEAQNFVFKYRKMGTTEWTKVNADVQGNVMTGHLTNLSPATVYQYCAACDNFDGVVKTFTTELQAQLPNYSFETWATDASDGCATPYADASSMFWDTGNHGSITLSKNVTTSDSDVKHGGSYSAKMKSQFVGVFGIGKFAAGNIFSGKYLATDGTDGVLGFGRAFTSRPKSMTGYVKYSPGSVDYYGSGSGVSKGETDNGIIYVALLDGTTMSYNSEVWPQIIKTKTAQLFDPSANNSAVIAYGALKLTQATVADAGESMTKFTINLDYRDNRVPKAILVVASSSMYGDYFSGSTSSVMWIDDFVLNY